MTLTEQKKIRRHQAGLCLNCGKDKCTCRKPKGKGYPVGIDRRGTQGIGHPRRSQA